MPLEDDKSPLEYAHAVAMVHGSETLRRSFGNSGYKRMGGSDCGLTSDNLMRCWPMHRELSEVLERPVKPIGALVELTDLSKTLTIELTIMPSELESVPRPGSQWNLCYRCTKFPENLRGVNNTDSGCLFSVSDIYPGLSKFGIASVSGPALEPAGLFLPGLTTSVDRRIGMWTDCRNAVLTMAKAIATIFSKFDASKVKSK